MDNKKTFEDFRKEVADFVTANLDKVDYCQYNDFDLRIVFNEVNDRHFELKYESKKEHLVFQSRGYDDVQVKIDPNKKLTVYEYDTLMKMYEVQLMDYQINENRMKKLNSLLELELNERLNHIENLNKDSYRLYTNIFYNEENKKSYMNIEFCCNPYGILDEYASTNHIILNVSATEYSKENIDTIFNAIKQSFNQLKNLKKSAKLG